MARIRTIKPEFFTSEDIVELTPLSRLFYVSLWCESDREGRLNWKPKTLKYRYLPGDDCDIDELAHELVESGLIRLYEVDGKEYCEIPTFTTHQVINNREKQSEIPPNPHACPTRQHASKSRESGEKAEGKEGKEGKAPSGTPAGNYVFDGETIQLNRKDYEKLKAQYPNIDLDYQLAQLDLELRGKRNWFVEMNSKLNYRNKTPAHHAEQAGQVSYL